MELVIKLDADIVTGILWVAALAVVAWMLWCHRNNEREFEEWKRMNKDSRHTNVA